MNLRKDIQVKFYIDYKTNIIFRKILKVKNLKIQHLLENLLKKYIYSNLDLIIDDDINE